MEEGRQERRQAGRKEGRKDRGMERWLDRWIEPGLGLCFSCSPALLWPQGSSPLTISPREDPVGSPCLQAAPIWKMSTRCPAVHLVNAGAIAGFQPKLSLGCSQTAVTPQACQRWVELHTLWKLLFLLYENKVGKESWLCWRPILAP